MRKRWVVFVGASFTFFALFGFFLSVAFDFKAADTGKVSIAGYESIAVGDKRTYVEQILGPPREVTKATDWRFPEVKTVEHWLDDDLFIQVCFNADGEVSKKFCLEIDTKGPSVNQPFSWWAHFKQLFK
jgi:hypothetical protein